MGALARWTDGRALLEEGEARAAVAAPTRVAVGVPVALGPDEASAPPAGGLVAVHLRDPHGAAVPATAGRALRHGRRRRGRRRGRRRPELPAVAEELAREVTLLGTYDEAADAIAAWFAAGADSVPLVLPPGARSTELAELVDVAPASCRPPRGRSRSPP